MCYSNPLFLSEKLGIRIPSWLCNTVLRWGLWRECISPSYPFRCGCFLSCLIGKSHWASFWIFLRGSCSMCTCIFSVSTEGENSEASCMTTLVKTNRQTNQQKQNKTLPSASERAVIHHPICRMQWVSLVCPFQEWEISDLEKLKLLA